MVTRIRAVWIYFNPRSPRGERPAAAQALLNAAIFQSTLPSRGATTLKKPDYDTFVISIHAPLAGSDHRFCRLFKPVENFNPRSPRGERRQNHTKKGAVT